MPIRTILNAELLIRRTLPIMSISSIDEYPWPVFGTVIACMVKQATVHQLKGSLGIKLTVTTIRCYKGRSVPAGSREALAGLSPGSRRVCSGVLTNACKSRRNTSQNQHKVNIVHQSTCHVLNQSD
jgi:hypothetical protein